jgi:hypothetical protein
MNGRKLIKKNLQEKRNWVSYCKEFSIWLVMANLKSHGCGGKSETC